MITKNNPSNKLTFEDAVRIWPRIWNKEYQNRIAAEYDVNPGRISEINTGKLHPGSYDKAILRFGIHMKPLRKSQRKDKPLPLFQFFDLIQKKGRDDA